MPPEFAPELEGQRYVVIRLESPVLDVWSDIRQRFEALIAPESAFGPLTGHVTLRGFPPGTATERIETAIKGWAEQTPPLSIHATGIDTFEEPGRVVFLGVESREDLKASYGKLVGAISEAGLAGMGNFRPALAVPLLRRILPRPNAYSLVEGSRVGAVVQHSQCCICGKVGRPGRL